ncbi:MAG: DUF86 domain-containing protein [Defluviitaleaceae bacterium]|nr:DUF86 domain-containing protein [Defluviitaleaceae bacterium]
MDIEVVLNKVSVMDRCIKRIHDTYEGNPEVLTDFDKQDVIVLNLQRACQSAISLGMHVCKRKKMGLPQDSGDVFELLFQGNVISLELATRMKKMVGFRNTVVHDYQGLNLNILRSIVENHLSELTEYGKNVLTFYEND